VIHSGQNKGQLEGLVQFPGNHEAREPVQNGHQVHPATCQADIGDVNAPDVIGVLSAHLAQQIGVNLVLRGRFARIWAGSDARNAHFTHITLHHGPRNRDFLLVEFDRDTPGTIKRPARVNLVDAVFDDHLCRRRWQWMDSTGWNGSSPAVQLDL